VLIVIIFLIGIVDAGDEVEIQSLIDTHQGGIAHLSGKVYTITNPIYLKSNVILEGESGTVIKLADNAGWADWVPLIKGEGIQNIEIRNIEFFGNDEKQDATPTWTGPHGTSSPSRRGQGYFNFIHVIDCDSIKVYRCSFHDNLGDGFRVKTSTNIEFYENTAYRLGHDAFFTIDSKNVKAYDNRITTRTNSALRNWNSEGVRFYDNVIDAQQDSIGGYPGIQIEYSKNLKPNVEICGNTLYMTWGPGIWLIAYDAGTKIQEGSWIHHNWFASTGTSYNIANTGGISDDGATGNLIENNVFDSCHNDAIEVKSSGTSTIRNNIITNTLKHVRTNVDGFGISNENSASLTITSNCFYNNIAGNLHLCTSTNDDLQDPKTHQTSSGWTWDSKSWRCPEVKPTDLSDITPAKPGVVPTKDIDNHDPLELLKRYRDSITDTAIEGGNSYHTNIKKEKIGNIEAGVDIVGYRNMVQINGNFYIQSIDDIITASEANNLAPSSLTTDQNVTYKDNGDGTVTADLRVDIAYNVYKASHVLQKGKVVPTLTKSMKTETAHFYDTEKLPEIIRGQELTTVNVSINNNTVNPKTIFYVTPSLTTTKISYENNGQKSWHFIKAGVKKTTPKGVEYVKMDTVDGWRLAEGIGSAGGLYQISKALTPEQAKQVKIISYSAFGDNTVLEADKIDVHNEDLSKAVHPLSWLLLIILAVLLGGTYYNVKVGLRWKF